MTLLEFYSKRKKILIRRNTGGLGDILMHRMIFEDFKILMPDSHLTFACPKQYFQAVEDHPFIDEIVDHKETKDNDYGITFDTSVICNKYEMKTAPFCDKHRCDIWAEHCGVTLSRHNMHIKLRDEENEWAAGFIKKMNPENRKTVVISPVSAMSSKNMTPEQIKPVYDVLSKDYCVFALHSQSLPHYVMPCIAGTSIRHFISLINNVDYVISVDTSVFHCAGGLGKPVVGIFGWADGKVYSKYYPKVILVQKHRDHTPGWTCGPCYKFTSCCKVPDQTVARKPCITEITPAMILDGFDKMVNIY